jgi:hypothetical protein
MKNESKTPKASFLDLKNAPVISEDWFFNIQGSETNNPRFYRLEAENDESGSDLHLLSFVYPQVDAEITCRLEWEDYSFSEIPKRVRTAWLRFLAENNCSIFSFGYILGKNIWVYEKWEASTDELQCIEMDEDELDDLIAEYKYELLDSFRWEPSSRKKVPGMEIVFQGIYPIRFNQLAIARRAYQVGQKQASQNTQL